jgi:hypothetical protein
MLALSSQSFNQGKVGILFGDMNGASPIKTTGTLIGTTGTTTVTHGIDFSSYVFSGSVLKGPAGSGTVDVFGVNTKSVTIANNDFDTLSITGSHPFFTGMHIANTITGGKDWGIYSLGGSLGGPAGNFVIYDNTPSTGGPRFSLAPNGNTAISGTVSAPAAAISGAVTAGSLAATGAVTAQTLTLTNNSPDALFITGSHTFYTGARIANTSGSGDWGIYAGGAGWGGSPGALVINDNTPTTGGPRMIINKNGNISLGAAVYMAPQGSAPTAIEGGFYYNSSSKHFFGYDGTTWKQLDN